MKQKVAHSNLERSDSSDVFCTCLCNADVEDGCLVFLRKVLGCSFEAESAVLLFHHFKYSDGVSIR